jgi:uncharacterized protein
VYHDLDGFALDEVGREEANSLWLRGGFPRSYLAESSAESFEWRRAFIRTFLERDMPELGIQIPAQTLHRFWRMLANYHGQVWNGAETRKGLRRFRDQGPAASGPAHRRSGREATAPVARERW